jgi:hypothetical protein
MHWLSINQMIFRTLPDQIELGSFWRLGGFAAAAATLGMQLLKSRVLRLGVLQDGGVGVSVFPEREEIFVGGERTDAGGIGIRTLRSFRFQSFGTSHSQMR